MRYGREAEVLKDISFELPRGSFHFLTGPSGSGKSTLLKLIYLAEQASRGRIEIFGQDLALLKRERPAADAPAGSAWCSRSSGCSST